MRLHPRRIGLLAATALALLAAAPARPQPATEPRTMPPEMLAPSEEARSFFEEAEANPLAGEMLGAVPPEMAEPLDAVIAEIMARGEQVPNWQDLGVDLERIAAAREGGLAGNMTNATNDYGVQRTYFADRPLEAIIPPGLRLVARHGPAVEGGNVNIEIGHISPRLIMVMRVDYRRPGRAHCQQRAETRLYSDPRIPASEVDIIAFVMTLRHAARIDELGVCFGTEEREPGVYISRVFDREGHRLPGMDEGQPLFRIVPVAPFPAAAARP